MSKKERTIKEYTFLKFTVDTILIDYPHLKDNPVAISSKIQDEFNEEFAPIEIAAYLRDIMEEEDYERESRGVHYSLDLKNIFE